MGFNSLHINRFYRSTDGDISSTFLNPVLENCVFYKRAVGFFSSSSLIHICRGLEKIYLKNGKVQYIMSPELSDEDIRAIMLGYENREKIIENALIKSFYRDNLDAYDNNLNLISYYISTGFLDIKIAVSSSNSLNALYHEKIGIMVDENGEKIAFIGSLNETENAFINNTESIVVFKSEFNDDYVNTLEKAFDDLWNNVTNKVHVYDFPEAVKNCILKYKKTTVPYPFSLNEPSNSQSVEPTLENVDLYDYQKNAIVSWIKNQRGRGIFDMATGTGKTFTALGALVKLYELNRKRLATIIICPFTHLVDQWAEESRLFGIIPIIAYGETKNKYLNELKMKVKDFNDGIINHFTLIITNGSFMSKEVQILIDELGDDSLIIADEAHYVGSQKLKNFMPQRFQFRLALSATIDRHRDDDGTSFIYEYFGSKCIEYGLERAIREGKLTQYFYYPHVVTLNSYEFSNYMELSEKLSRCMISNGNGSIKLSSTGEKIALERARLVSSASNKIFEFRNNIQGYLNDYFILVYGGTSKIMTKDNIELRDLERVTKILGDEMGFRVGRYTSKETILERRQIREQFKSGTDIQILAAIKCLDEGVNIPNIKTAFILSSTTNPKEYIQRRGRILRLSENKKFSEIHDYIVVPVENTAAFDKTSKEFKYMKRLVLSEVERMKEYSSVANNMSESNLIIEKLTNEYELNHYNSDDYLEMEWSDENDI